MPRTAPDTTPRHADRTPNAAERSDIARRALAAYLRTPDAHSHASDPLQARTATKTRRSSAGVSVLTYGVVHAQGAVLAGYRARPLPEGWMLRRLTRWPADLVRLKPGSDG